jgi:hypothetical protein
MVRTPRLLLEILEDRTVPAQFGIPWPDPTHLTLSFAPDGTQVAGQQSELFQILNAQQPTAQWQGAILRALQTWVASANLNVGVVSDDGSPFGSGGHGDGNAAFGDIRIAAMPMDSDVLAISVPSGQFHGGRWSGAVVLNSAYNFTEPDADLYSVMLHEFGNVLGLPDSNDPSSVMYVSATQPRQQLAPSDIAALQALYGPRTGGAVTSLSNPQSIAYPASPQGYSGQTPLVQYGNLAMPGDGEWFAVQALPSYQGAMTFRLQTGGISLLQPHLTVYDAAGQVLGSLTSYQKIGDVISVTVPQVTPGAVYYAKIEGATSDMFAAGRFALAVTFDAQLQTPANVIDAILRGPYDSLTPAQLDQLFRDAAQAWQNNGSSDDGGGSISPERSAPAGDTGYAQEDGFGSLPGSGALTYYRLAAPASEKDVATGSGATPTAEDPQATADVATGSGATPTAEDPQATGGNGDSGNGDHEHGSPAAVLIPIIDGALTAAAPQQGGMLLLDQTQLVMFVLSTDGTAAITGTGPGVQMTVTDASGNVLLDLTAPVGNTVPGNGVLLNPGAYAINFTGVSPTGVLPPSLGYHLRAASLSDPIGPVLKNPTVAPTPVWPVNPSQYPNIAQQLLTNPFFWLGGVV